MNVFPPKRVLIARLDSAGDVVLAGPAVRAVAESGAAVTFLCSHRGMAAARLLPGVSDLLVFNAPWILADSPPVDVSALDQLIAALKSRRYDEAIILTSFHQCPLPLALLLRVAGVPRISAVSEEYPGGLLDVRIRLGEDMHEAERAAAIATAAGYPADPRLEIVGDLPDPGRWVAGERYVVLHPGADAPAREIPTELARRICASLAAAGWQVVVTGAPSERETTRVVAGDEGTDLGGLINWGELAGVIRGAEALVVGNTGPAHLAAALGTPVVSLWTPVVPPHKWRPYGVPNVLLGNPLAPCRGTRARGCDAPGHPCLASLEAAQVTAAVEQLAGVAA